MTADFPAGFFETVPTGQAGAAGLDDAAVAAIRDLYSDLGIDGRVLDLCGAGLDQFDVPPDELVVFDGDPNEPLSYGDDAFDDVLCTGGVGTFTHPRDTFADVARILRPGGRFVCTFTTLLFTEEAVRGWVSTDDAGRVRIVRAYFSLAPAFGPAESDLRTSLSGTGDRLWAVWAAKRR
ncbi:class I SAM-dependent methyltransferase [Solirubrobacter ginsenosidimutans]|uniref:Class I SAM-dependent methyltransferase n=1 Tax=Solirubrobacter ginsenosidimutans TaxID=490573 RepID=A0A9X3S500_9ACTN|nr:methyltransferase domain-containing protein [Solirubrobacter ginsenosidimutans]MDA0163636.1 class I SAM-dependent methyltransferase [Solirubrobacter ginsenosidimutans]